MDFDVNDLIEKFPFPTIRPRQLEVFNEIAEALNSGYKYIVLEAPTGFGKSPVAVTLGRALGSSYLCSATKDLQSQYTRDFPFLRSVKGKNNFPCLVREDFILHKMYGCEQCEIDTNRGKNVRKIEDCKHKAVNYGPCRIKGSALNHSPKYCDACASRRSGRGSGDGEEENGSRDFSLEKVNFHVGCRYRTWEEDYEISNPNTPEEDIYIPKGTMTAYQKHSTDADSWLHLRSFQLKNLDPIGLDKYTSPDEEFLQTRQEFLPCGYYDQWNKGLIARHTIFNYKNFLIFLRRKQLSGRQLLILDEGHQIESQVADDIGISISSKTIRKYIGPDGADLLESARLSYDTPIPTWMTLLSTIYNTLEETIPLITPDELRMDADDQLQRLGDTIAAIKGDITNWVVSEIVDSNDEARKYGRKVIAADFGSRKILKVTFKPLDVAPYCDGLLTHCTTTFIMSATILDIDTFCRNIGLKRDQVKFIEVGSDFPIENRPIYPLNVAHLNYNSLKIPQIQNRIADAIDKIMSIHSKDKGIIHTTSYTQVRFIEDMLSRDNRRRLVKTDPDIPRDEVIAKHWLEMNKGSVLISPSLHTGLDLKDEQSRFQILVKIPYPSKADRWISKKLQIDGGRWYNWQTALKLVQACGRSIRSKDDWAKTYVLDSTFDRFIRENKLPIWFKEAISSAD